MELTLSSSLSTFILILPCHIIERTLKQETSTERCRVSLVFVWRDYRVAGALWYGEEWGCLTDFGRSCVVSRAPYGIM
jgi:hypothetical protein